MNLSVTDLSIIDTTESSISLEWTPVTCFARNSLPVNVDVAVYEFSSRELVNRTGPFTADTGYYTQTGLEPQTEYFITLFTIIFGPLTVVCDTSVTGMTQHREKK